MDETRDGIDEAGHGTGEVSLLLRLDFTVTDAGAVIDSGRRALIAADPDVMPEQVVERVVTVDDALLAITDVLGIDVLIEDTDGLEVRTVVAEVARDLDPVEFEPDERLN